MASKGEGRDTLRGKHDLLREKFKESDRKMTEGVGSGSTVEKAARDVVARFTAEGRDAVQRSLDRARDAAVVHVKESAREQDQVLTSEAKPFTQDQQEAGRGSRDDAQAITRAQGDAAVAGTREALAEAARAAEQDAEFREKLASDQDNANERAEKTAQERSRAVNATSSKLS
jgi:hypothetical protein